MVSGRKGIFIGIARICLVFAEGKNSTQDFFRWYEAKVTGWKCTSSLKSLVVSVLARDTVPGCKIKFIDEVIIHLFNYVFTSIHSSTSTHPSSLTTI